MGRLHIAVVICGLTVAGRPAMAQPVAAVRTGPVAGETEEARSHLWESALDPQRAPYEQLVGGAERQMRRRTKEAARLAIEALDDAIARIPQDGRAYALRGQAHLVVENWPECSADLAKSLRAATVAELENPGDPWKSLTRDSAGMRSTPDDPWKSLTRDDPGDPWKSLSRGKSLTRDQGVRRWFDRGHHSVDLGICQGRAEQLSDAERTLAQAASRSPRSEPWLRLGEVRIALGKLEDAIEALETALDKQDAFRPFIEWLLAIANDRAGRPNDAETHAAQALAYDSTFNSLIAPRFPWLRIGDRNYALALAHQAHGAVEFALGHYRRFTAVAPQSPWRQRAEQHIRELSALELPQWLQRDPTSSATVDLVAIKPLIRRAIPALRACTKTQPATVFTVAITRYGPRTPISAHNQPPGSQATPASEIESGPSDDRTNPPQPAAPNSARHCLERVADRIPLPFPRERDTWYRIRFAVVAP